MQTQKPDGHLFSNAVDAYREKHSGLVLLPWMTFSLQILLPHQNYRAYVQLHCYSF